MSLAKLLEPMRMANALSVCVSQEWAIAKFSPRRGRKTTPWNSLLGTPGRGGRAHSMYDVLSQHGWLGLQGEAPVVSQPQHKSCRVRRSQVPPTFFLFTESQLPAKTGSKFPATVLEVDLSSAHDMTPTNFEAYARKTRAFGWRPRNCGRLCFLFFFCRLCRYFIFSVALRFVPLSFP